MHDGIGTRIGNCTLLPHSAREVSLEATRVALEAQIKARDEYVAYLEDRNVNLELEKAQIRQSRDDALATAQFLETRIPTLPQLDEYVAQRLAKLDLKKRRNAARDRLDRLEAALELADLDVAHVEQELTRRWPAQVPKPPVKLHVVHSNGNGVHA